MSVKRIAVVGAGISGLACAYELQKKGFAVTVFEKEHQVGGRMSSRKKDGLTFDIGANHLCNMYAHMKAYCTELGVPFVPMKFLAYRVYKEGHIVPIMSALSRWSRWRLAIEFLKIRKNNLDFFNLNSTTAFDHTDARTYMTAHIGHEATAYIADAFSTTYQFHQANDISLGAVKGVMESLKYHIKDWDLQQTVGGMIALSEAIAKKVTVQVHTPVSQVIGGTTVQVVADTIETFDAVVIATTADCTKKILSNPTAGQRELLDATRYASTISLAFVVEAKALPDIAVVWVPRVESDTISGMTNERMKGEGFVKDGKSLLCVWLHEEYAKRIMHLSDEEIYAKIKTEVLKYCPWFSEEAVLTPFDLQRWPAAMPKFYQGYLTTVRKFFESSQGDNHVFFCGDYLNSTWTEGSLRCGQRVAEQVASSFV